MSQFLGMFFFFYVGNCPCLKPFTVLGNTKQPHGFRRLLHSHSIVSYHLLCSQSRGGGHGSLLALKIGRLPIWDFMACSCALLVLQMFAFQGRFWSGQAKAVDTMQDEDEDGDGDDDDDDDDDYYYYYQCYHC